MFFFFQLKKKKELLTVVLIDFQWIYWVGPFAGAAAAAFYHQYILRAAAIKALGSFRSNA